MFYALGTGAILERAFASAGVAMPRAIVQCASYAAALALLAKTDTLGLLIPPMLEEPYGQRQLRQIKIQETLPAAVIGMYARADAPFTPAAASMAQAVTATARRIARGR